MSGRPLMLALGKFDSLHAGHRALVHSAAANGRPGVVHFAGMAPVLGWEPRRPLLTERQFQQVLQLWAGQLRAPISVVQLDFSRLVRLGPEDFLLLLRDHYGVGGVVVGEDFRFGHERSGDVDTLRDLCPRVGLRCAVVAPVRHAGAVVSTTAIRAAIERGAVIDAGIMLRRPYRISGVVVQGDGRGRQLEFPTANLGGVDNLLPADGVYAGWVRLNQREPGLPAAINIGVLPTIGVTERRIEVHLIDWSGDCYGQAIDVDLVDRIRPERRFDGLKQLRAQIAQDVQAAREALRATTHERRRSTTIIS